MNVLARWAARILGGILRLLFRAPAPSTAERPAAAPMPRRGQEALVSPWRIYRLYAHPPRLLVRNEQGKVVSLGVVGTDALTFDYRLNSGARGAGFASLGALLEHAAGFITSTGIESEIKRLPACDQDDGAEPGEHLDVSLRANK